ncbi:MAG: hypothetical protein WCD64_06430, partial [Pseudolabrys sp.]
TCTDHSSGTLPRPWSGHRSWSWSWSWRVRACNTAAKRKANDRENGKLGRGHIDSILEKRVDG